MAACHRGHDLLVEAFRGADGIGWHEQDSRVVSGLARLFRPAYAATLVRKWIPSLDGVLEKLLAGASVTDVGCGPGASTVVMATAFSRSTFAGFDIHPSSIEAAREAAVQAGVDHRARFEVACAADLPGQGYDLACLFHTLHEMGDPVRAARRIRQALADDGTLLLVEPYAGDALEDSLNPMGRGFYALPAVFCPPGSPAPSVGPALGLQAGESALMSVLGDAGFTQFRRVAQTPLSIVLEAKP